MKGIKLTSINNYILNLLNIKDENIHIITECKEKVISFKYDINNGVIEGTNNLIKCIKRIAFGYRKFDHFIARVFLIKCIIKGDFSSPPIINSFIRFTVYQHYLTKSHSFINIIFFLI